MDDFDLTPDLDPHHPGPDHPDPHDPGPVLPTSAAAAPRRLHVGTPADLLASVPVLLGFVPTESVVMLTIGPGRGPHARIDLVEDHPREAAQALVAPALRHDVRQVALVVHCDLDRAEGHTVALLEAFAAADIEVVAAVAADGHHWLSMAPGLTTRVPQAYDPMAHRFVAEAVLSGQVVLASREELARGLEPQTGLVVAVQDQLDAWEGQLAAALDPAGVQRSVRAAVAQAASPSPRQTAELRLAVRQPWLRDHTWAWVSRDDARAHVDLWRHVVRSCASGEASGPASVLALHAWLVGDGALAWCALDRATEDGGGTSLSALVEDLLDRAVAPARWRPLQRILDGTDAAEPGRRQGGAEVVSLDERRRSSG